jgi:hypothetical protein
VLEVAKLYKEQVKAGLEEEDDGGVNWKASQNVNEQYS